MADSSLAVYFLLHYPGPYDRWTLSTTLSCGARTFLPFAEANQRPRSPLRGQQNYTRLPLRTAVAARFGTLPAIAE
jgi:hypothetical protein